MPNATRVTSVVALALLAAAPAFAAGGGRGKPHSETEDSHAGESTDPEDKMATWRKRLFIGLAHNAANPAESFCLPEDRTIVMGAHIDL